MFFEIRDDREEVTVVDTLQVGLNLTKDSKVNKIVKDMVVYNVITTSDKVINCRVYPKDKVKLSVLENRWNNPFPRPLLSNHDGWATPKGRVIEAGFYDHETKKVDGSLEIPQEIIDYFDSKNCFDNGTGSVIGKMIVTEDSLEKIKNSIYITTSQSSRTDAYTCNICNSDYFECSHRTGRTYEIGEGDSKREETCYPRTGNLFPVENSLVNNPANDVSIMAIYDTKNKKIITTEFEKMIYGENSDSLENEQDLTTDNKMLQNDTEDIAKNKKEGVETVEKAEIEKREKKLKDRESKLLITKLQEKGLSDEDKGKVLTALDSLKIEDLDAIDVLVDSFCKMLDSSNEKKEAELKDLSDEITKLKEEAASNEVTAETNDEDEEESTQTEDAEGEEGTETTVEDSAETPNFLKTKDENKITDSSKKEDAIIARAISRV